MVENVVVGLCGAVRVRDLHASRALSVGLGARLGANLGVSVLADQQ